MGFDTVYFFVSVALLFAATYMLYIMVTFRRTGRNITGNIIDKKHPAYKSMVNFTSNSRIAITVFFTLLFALNMYHDVRLVSSIYDPAEATILFIAGPAINLIVIGFAVRSARHSFRK